MENTALSLATTALSTAHIFTPAILRNWNFNPYASYTELGATAHKFYLREDNGSPTTKVNVFNGAGKHIYTFERGNSRSTKWVLFAVSDRSQIAAIAVSLRGRYISYLQKPELKHQNVNGWLNNSFNLNDGSSCVWTRESRKLERVVNAGNGHDEIHQQLGQMRLLRRFRFDWELVVSDGIDPEVALCTSFVAASTIWSRATSVSAPSVTV